MSNPFFEAMMGNKPGGGMPSKEVLVQMAQQFKRNPFNFLLQKKLNIPPNLMGNPDAMLGYLLQSGQVQQSQVDWAKQQMAQQGFK